MRENDLRLLLGKKNFLVEIGDKKFHTQYGVIDLSELKKKEFGDKIKTHTGKKFTIVKPNIVDILMKKTKRLPQVIMPKDVALILAYTGVPNNAFIVDAGTGSGFLAIFLGYYLCKGRVVTYEKNKKFYEIAQKNVEIVGLKNIKIKNKDVTEGIDEKNVDLITLDMKNAERVVEHAHDSLKPGGWLVVYSPYIEQVVIVRKEIEKNNFVQLKTVENIVREWQSEKSFTRPRTIGLMHTGWLTFARKI